MSAGMTTRGVFALAVDGLRRKLGRNLLTMSGVFIGVLALTLIVSLGEGLSSVISDTVSQQDNLRQIGLSAGFGRRISDDTEVEISGVDDAGKRERLRRAALARRRPGPRIGRRAQTLDQAALDEVAKIPHVERVTPIVLERYSVTLDAHTADASSSLGVDVGRRRYAERTVVGSYFSSPDANEVLIHEYLAYLWGLRTDAELASLVGKALTLDSLGGAGANRRMSEMSQALFAQAMQGDLLDELTDEERAALPSIAQKIVRAMAGTPSESEKPRTYTLKIVGVVRELEPNDNFNIIEDGNAFQVDLFMPQATAMRMYLDSAVNRDIGYGRALVVVDDSANAPEVEDELRDRGLTAFSVASVVSRVETAVSAITVIIVLLTGIALIVAALGIVNTMVTSVLERTREIGLWKAVGATDAQVRTVFLIEAGLIGLVGGLLGLGVAVLLMIPGESVAKSLIAERAIIPIAGDVFRMPFWLPFAGPLLAAGVAMLASLYPAHRAARVDPVRALRHD